jgi:steroid delta-isomerase-like uncharacterized protein
MATQAKTRTNDKAKTAEAKAPAKAPGRRRITKRKAVEAHVRSYFEALAAHDFEAAASHFREDGVDDIVPMRVLRGRDEIARYFRDLFAATPDAELTVTRLVAGEREAAVEWRLRGTHSGAPFEGIEPTGKQVEFRGLDLFEVEDGQIVSNTGYFDGADYARQIGMLPAQESGAERAMKNAFNAVTKVRRAIDERRNNS